MIRLALLIFILLISLACGGGGGGGGGSSSSSAASIYQGKAEPAEVTEESIEMAAETANGDSSSGMISYFKAGNFKKRDFGYLDIFKQEMERIKTVSDSEGKISMEKIRRYYWDDSSSSSSVYTYNDGQGGYVEYNYNNINDDGIGKVVITYSNYYDSYYGDTTNGKIVLNYKAYDDIYTPTRFSISFEDLSYSYSSSWYKIAGSIEYVYQVDDYSLQSDMNLAFTSHDSTTDVMYQNFSADLTFYDSNFYYLKSEDISGKLYMGAYGYFDIDMSSPFIYSKYSDYPESGGPAIFIGEGSASAKVEPSGSQMKVSYDLDSDGTYETIEFQEWTDGSGIIETIATDGESSTDNDDTTTDEEGDNTITLQYLYSFSDTSDFYRLDEDGRFVFMVAGNLIVFDPDTEAYSSTDVSDSATTMDVKPNGDVLISSFLALKSYDVENDQVTSYDLDSSIDDIAVMNDTQVFILDDDDVYLYDLGTQEKSAENSIGTSYSINKIAFNATSNLLMAYGKSGSYIELFKYENGELINQYSNKYMSYGFQSFIDDGSRFVTRDGQVYRTNSVQYNGDLSPYVSYYQNFENVYHDQNSDFLYVLNDGSYSDDENYLSIRYEENLKLLETYTYTFGSNDDDYESLLFYIAPNEKNEFYILVKHDPYYYSDDGSTIIYKGTFSPAIDDTYDLSSVSGTDEYPSDQFFDFEIEEVAFDKANNKFYVTGSDDSFVELSTSTNTLTSISVGSSLDNLEMSIDGDKLVLSSSNQLLVYDISTQSWNSDYLDFIPEDIVLDDDDLYVLNTESYSSAIVSYPTDFTSLTQPRDSYYGYNSYNSFNSMFLTPGGNNLLAQSNSYAYTFEVDEEIDYLGYDYFYYDIINVFDRNGTTYLIDENAYIRKLDSYDLEYQGYFSGIGISDVSVYSEDDDYLIIASNNSYGSDTIEIFEFSSLDSLGSYTMPDYTTDDSSYDVKVKELGLSSNGRTIHVVFEVEGDSGLKYNGGWLELSVDDILD